MQPLLYSHLYEFPDEGEACLASDKGKIAFHAAYLTDGVGAIDEVVEEPSDPTVLLEVCHLRRGHVWIGCTQSETTKVAGKRTRVRQFFPSRIRTLDATQKTFAFFSLVTSKAMNLD